MGGEIGAVRAGASPRFAVLAVKDPGTPEVEEARTALRRLERAGLAASARTRR